MLKTDNGPGFTSVLMRVFLNHHDLQLLLSPAYTPTHNGACKAGNGNIKHLTHQIACRYNRPECWTLDDLEAARLLANHRITDRVQTLNPEERLAKRIPITTDNRIHCRATVAKHREQRRVDSEIATAHGARRIAAHALERPAIADALVDTGAITIRSRRVRLSYPQYNT